ncbi:MAG: cation:proton antiporter [Tepidisphaeraceae bacterium]
MPLFPAPTEPGQWPVNDVIWSFAQFVSIVLLFVTGLHTDLKQFLRYVGPATLVAVVGIVAPFALGVACVYIPAFADLARATPDQPVLIPALFVGAILAATVVILALAKPIERVLTGIKYGGAMLGLGLALAFVCSAVAEFFGLAFIIGAYSVGLGLSRTGMAHKLMDELKPVSDFIVPVFFATLGMLVDFNAMLSDWRVVVFGLVVTLAAIVGKLAGCGLAALPAGFNGRGAYRVGLGMMPRGEVALIVAGIGLSRGIIGQNVFGVSIMMTLLTTIIAPILLVPAFRTGGGGRRRPDEFRKKLPSTPAKPGLVMNMPPDMGEMLVNRLLKAAEARGWEGAYERADEEIYLLRNGPDAAQVQLIDGALRVDASDTRQPEFAEFLLQVKRSVEHDASRVTTQAGVHVAGATSAPPVPST